MQLHFLNGKFIFSSMGALEIQMLVCLLVGLSVCLLVTFTQNSVIFGPRSFKFCVVVDIEVIKKIIKKNFKFFFSKFFFQFFFWKLKKI